MTLCRVALVVFATTLFAQTPAGVTGTVIDPSGGAVAGATVTLRNSATGVAASAVTSAAGTYVFPSLPAGVYEAEASAGGFKRSVTKGVVLDTGFVRTVDFRMEVGAVSDRVEVVSSAPLLEAERATVGQLIERSSVMNIPVESRRAAALIRLTGYAMFNGESGDQSIPNVVMGGGRSANQLWLLDGASAQNAAPDFPVATMNPPAESMQEFKAEVGNYSAEYGRIGGGLILMTTRGGTNRFQGALYHFLRNDALDARSFFAGVKAPLRFNVSGGSLGGRLRRDKTFFFTNYEGSRRRTGSSFGGTIVPRAAERAGDFSARIGLIVMDPTVRQPFPGNRIPDSRLDPVARRLAALWPQPNVTTDPARAATANFLSNGVQAVTQDFGVVRLDHNFSDRDRLFLRYTHQTTTTDFASVYPNRLIDTSAARNETPNHVHLLGNWFHAFNPTTFQEVQFLNAGRSFSQIASGQGSGLNGQLGIKGANPESFARLDVTGVSSLGRASHFVAQNPIPTREAKYRFTAIRGRHTWRTGGEFRYSKYGVESRSLDGGRFQFTDRATGDGMATFLLGWTTAGEVNSRDPVVQRADYFGVFVQDDWKVTSRLTLNLGLRWDMDRPKWEANNRQSGFDGRAINPISGTPGIVTFAGVDGVSRYPHDADANNFAPRFGFAWRAREALVIRGGYGVSFDPIYGRTLNNSLTVGFGLTATINSADGGFTPPFRLQDGLPVIERESLGAGFGAVRLGANPRISPEFVQRNHQAGYSQQVSLSIQQQIWRTAVIEVGYLGNLGHKLGGPDADLNQVPLVNGAGPIRQDQSGRPFRQFSGVMQLNPSWGNSVYHAGNLKLEKRYSNGLNLLMNYTWAKFIDDIEARNEIGGEPNNGYTHLELRRLDRAISGNDVRQRLVASGVYELPFGQGRRWVPRHRVVAAMAGGWGLGAILEMRTGTAFGVIEQTNRSNTFSPGQRPNMTAPLALNPDWRSNVLSQPFFRVSSFAAPGEGVFGNAPRNVGGGPGFAGLDLSVHKTWSLSERLRLQFRGDSFNALNRPNFGIPNGLRGGPAFGLTQSAQPGRQIQLSMRLEF